MIRAALVFAVGLHLASGVFPVLAQEPEPPMPPVCTVLRIIDGDTFECDLGGLKQSVRLLGIDAPESGQRPFGTQAKAALTRLIPVRSEAMLDLDVRERDRYGRVLAYVWNDDGVLVNEALLSRGYAVVSIEPPNVKYAEDFRAAARNAQLARRGLWATSAFDCPPADFRRKRCA